MSSSYSTNPPSETLKPGSKIFWMSRRHHIVAIFHDQGEQFFAIKLWFPSKQRWEYRVISQFEYDFVVNEFKKTQAGV